MVDFAKIALSIVTDALGKATPAVVEAARDAVASMRAKAEATPNPWDNVLVDTLEKLLGKE